MDSLGLGTWDNGHAQPGPVEDSLRAIPVRDAVPSKSYDFAQVSPAVSPRDAVSARNLDFHSLLCLLAEKYEAAAGLERDNLASIFKSLPSGKATKDMAVQTDVGALPCPEYPHSSGSEASVEGSPRVPEPGPSLEAMEASLKNRPSFQGETLNTVRRTARRVVRWPGFDFCVGAMIIANAACIGIELHLLLERRSASLLFVLEYAFLCAYVLELTLRIVALGCASLRDRWVQFDVVLVFFGVCSAVMHAMDGHTSEDVLLRGLDLIIIFRLLRLLRLVRAVRMLGGWHTLWKLASGAMHGLEPMASVFVLLSVAVFMYACIAAEMIARDPDLRSHPETKLVVEDYFSTMPKIVMTMMQFVMADSVNAVYKPIILVKPILSIFFLCIFFIITILLLNLITAVLVDDAISRSQLDAQMVAQAQRQQWARAVPQIRAAFQALDADCSGCIGIGEVLNANFTELGGGKFKDVAHFLKQEVLTDLYDTIDADGSGSITEDEFVAGLMRFALAEGSFDLAHVKQLIKASAKDIKELRRDVLRMGKATKRAEARRRSLDLAQDGFESMPPVDGPIPSATFII